MKKERLAALALSAVFAVGAAVPSFAAGEDETPAGDGSALPSSALYYGSVESIYRGEGSDYARVTMDSESDGTAIFFDSASTLYVDASAYGAGDPGMVAVGAGLYVVHSPVMTLSYPPQSSAYVFISNVPADASCPRYHEIESITENEDGETVITTDGGGLLMFVNDETALHAYDDSTGTELTAGGRILAWYDVVTASIPGQCYPAHILVLPDTADAEGDPAEQTTVAIPVRTENGISLVPVRTVAESLGFEVSYSDEGGIQSAALTDGERTVTIVIGETSVSVENGGAAGTVELAAAPYIEAPGITWAPAQLFEALGVTVGESGTGASFTF